MQAEDPETTVARIIELVKTRIPKRFGLDPIRDIQALCPMNRGGVGARLPNIELQAALHPAGDRKVERFGWTGAPGDKVMQIENDYDKEVYNGDIRTIDDVYFDSGELIASFDGRSLHTDWRARHAGARLRCDYPQKPGFRYPAGPSRCSPSITPCCRGSRRYRRHARQEAGRTGRTEEGGRHRSAQRVGAETVVESSASGRGQNPELSHDSSAWRVAGGVGSVSRLPITPLSLPDRLTPRATACRGWESGHSLAGDALQVAHHSDRRVDNRQDLRLPLRPLLAHKPPLPVEVFAHVVEFLDHGFDAWRNFTPGRRLRGSHSETA